MRRKPDLIRQIAFYIEDWDSEDEIDSTSIEIDGFTEAEIAYHCELMYDDKLFKAEDASHLGSRYKEFLISRLTTAGHLFAEAARSDTRWNKVKKACGEMGSVSIKFLTTTLQSLAEKEITDLLG